MSRLEDPLLGSVLHGARLEALIGEGSAARVYRAVHRILDRTYAVKVLSRRFADRSDQVERLAREARALSRIDHPNVVSVLDSGLTPDGRPFLTMELLEGRTLAEILQEGAIDRFRFLELATQMAAGLAAAHDAGLVHRDLKPSNVMIVEREGRPLVKLLDFGLARLTETGAIAPREHLTIEEALLGTPRYMAPEQIVKPAEAGPRADLYALGVIFYEMLSGRPPFDGSLISVLEQQLNAMPRALVTQTGFEALIAAMLQKSPDDRPPSAAAVHDALELLGEEAGPTRLAPAPVVPVAQFDDHTEVDHLLAEPTLMGAVPDTERLAPIDPITTRIPTKPRRPTGVRPKRTMGATDTTRVLTEDDVAHLRPQLRHAWSDATPEPKTPVRPMAPSFEVSALRQNNRLASVLAMIACAILMFLALTVHLRARAEPVVLAPAAVSR